MFLLVLVLNQTNKLEKILQKLYEAGITGTTVIDSQGWGETTMENLPFFGGIRSILSGKLSHNKVLFSVINSEEKTKNAIQVIETVTGDLEAGGKGILFTLPLHQVKGIAPPFNEPTDSEQTGG